MGLKLPNICLIAEEKLEKKNSPRKLFPTGDLTRARCMTVAHATACSIAVNKLLQGGREISAILLTVVGNGLKDQKVYIQYGV